MCGGRHAEMGFASPAYGLWQLSRHSQLFFHVLASLYVLPLSVRSLGISCVLVLPALKCGGKPAATGLSRMLAWHGVYTGVVTHILRSCFSVHVLLWLGPLD